MSNTEIIRLIADINNKASGNIRIMEVCGTHTQAIAKAGLSNILSGKIKLISGPGCPVCVTGEGYIDAAIELLQQKDTVIATFGDMVRVRGGSKGLEDCMELRERIKIVYSPFAVLDIAEANRDKEVVFLAVGFETTAPLIAALVKLARTKVLNNLSFLVGLKLMPPVLKQVLSNQGNKLDGIICPGHVSSVMGSDYFSFIPNEYGIPAVVSGFEQLDVASSVHWLMKSIAANKPAELFNIYSRCVQKNGNEKAQKLMQEMFEKRDGYWRGIGVIEDSELRLNDEFKAMDAEQRFGISIKETASPSSCQCGDIITGSKSPFDCGIFAVGCTPENPKGPCMISSEGTCSIYYKYKRSCAI